MNMRDQRPFRIACAAVIVAGALGQAGAACCKYLYDWGAPTTECTGLSTTLCESSAASCSSTDGANCKINNGTRWAKCYTWELLASGYFVHAPCNQPPTGGTLVGQLPDGTCCFAFNVKPFFPQSTDRDFQVSNCYSSCPPEI
jgi:hypothetical protein